MPRWPKRPDYKVEVDTGCWLWLKAKKPSGYGNLFKDGKWWSAHRYYYTQAKMTGLINNRDHCPYCGASSTSFCDSDCPEDEDESEEPNEEQK